MAIYRSLDTLGNLISGIPWPIDFFDPKDLPAFLDKIFVQDYQFDVSDTDFTGTVWLAFEGELSVGVPGLDGTQLVAGSNVPGFTFLTFTLAISNESTLTLNNIRLALRFDPSILKPAALTAGGPVAEFAEIQIEGSVRITSSFDLSVEGFDALKLTPAMIGDTGIIISAEDVKLDLSRASTLPEVAALGFDDSFIGIFIGRATVRLPKDFPPIVPEDVVLTNCAIGSGGVSGELRADYRTTPPDFNPVTKTFTGRGTGKFFGIPFATEQVTIKFKQNALVESKITGQLLLPYFDKRVAVEMGLDLNGGFTIKLTGVVEPKDKSDASKGLFTLVKPGILSIELQSIGFEIKDGVFITKLSGKLTPLFGAPDLEFPGFEVKELSVDSNGNVRLEGGWLDLRDQYSLDFYGFQFEITKIGFGKTNDGGKWIGFNGGLKLVDGFSAGASVEGLRLTWYDDTRTPQFSLDGVGVEFELEDVLSFKGAVSYKEEKEGLDTLHQFAGAIKVKIDPLDLTIDGVLVFGSKQSGNRSVNFFAIYLTTELPKGIPLFGSGLALYGMAGLFAYQMEPNKKADQEWYRIGDIGSWYLSLPVGVTDLKKKWGVKENSLALGAGVTIGTESDNGKAFAAKVLLVLVLPGPIILLQGGANINKNRSELSGNKEPDFRAIAVLDKRAGTFTLGLDAKYKYGANAELIDIRGSAEAFYSFNHADAWHVYLGEREPRDKRIRAELYRLFHGDCYVMVDARQLAMGASLGYDRSWGFSRLKVALEAWIECNAVVSWSPTHFFGELWMHGKASLKVFRFSAGLTVDARIEGDVFEPKHVKGNFKVGIKLPWFLPSYKANITLEWTEKTTPLLPTPLKEVSIDHKKTTTTWPLPRKALLLPDYDVNDDGLRDPSEPPPVGATFLPADVPFIPMDSSPTITFNRPINDDARVGGRVENMSPETERIGDPSKNQGPLTVRYGLTEISLEKRISVGWQTVALKKAGVVSPNPAGTPEIFGSWAPVPAAPDGGGDKINQVKLMLRSKTPFDYSRQSGRAWDEWFTDRFTPGGYPCAPPRPDRVICWNFEKISIAQIFRSPLGSVDHPGLTLSWEHPAAQTITALDQPLAGLSHALCFPRAGRGTTLGGGSNNKVISLPSPAKAVEITVAAIQDDELTECVSFRDRATGETSATTISGLGFKYTDASRVSSQTISFGDAGEGAGVSFGGNLTAFAELEITLPCLASVIDLTISYLIKPRAIEAYNKAGVKVAAVTRFTTSPDIISLSANGIEKVLIKGSQYGAFLHEICFSCPAGGRAEAAGKNAAGQSFPGVYKDDNTILVSGDGLTSVTIDGNDRICILQICALVGPDQTEAARRFELDHHLQTQVERWQQAEEILEPYTSYRLGVVTTIQAKGQGELSGHSPNYTQSEFAYFQTGGPPGLVNLARPIGYPETDSFDSGLNDLTRYVTQTVPATVPKIGEKPPLVRPVYRAYDMSIQFDGNYIDLMYRIAKRDLVLYLYDNNNLPVRDENGRAILLDNRWGTARQLTLTESEQRWLTIVSESNCATFELADIPKAKTLTALVENLVLEPDTLYEARLMPVLLLEDFSEFPVNATASGTDARLGLWRVLDEGVLQGPSLWVIAEVAVGSSHFVLQSSSIAGGADPLERRGTLLLRSDKDDPQVSPSEQPGNWTDYRFSARLRSSTDGAIGMVFRYVDEQNYYRFSMEHGQPYRRLVKVVNGTYSILTQDAFVYNLNQDYEVTIEALGSSLRIYQDDSLVFDAKDDSHPKGRIGFYCAANSGARFSNARADNFGAASPVVYRFSFTTSTFANFFHHLHSFQDETWSVSADLPDVSGRFSVSLPPSEEESGVFEALLKNVPDGAAAGNLKEVRVTQIKRINEPIAFLFQSPEPVDWERAEVKIKTAPQEAFRPHLPGAAKITDVAFGATSPTQESVTLLLRESTNISNYRIEYRLPDNPSGQSSWLPYYTFGLEKRLTAGTRIRVYASNEADSPASEPGIVRRFIASPGDMGQLRLQPEGVALRLVRPDGSEGHTRHFIPDTDYAEVSQDALQVLRKADGTAFFIMVLPAGPSTIPPLPVGQYRVELLYRRDNTSSHPDSMILSEAGNTSPEKVKLDIPWQSNQ